MKQTILFTGGHHNSSLVIAKLLKKQGYSVAWIGAKFATSKDKNLSAEYLEITQNNIPFFAMKTGKFYRHLNPFECLKIIIGFFQSLIYLRHLKPALIVSFGGYIAVPVVLAGWLLGIPSITHEQTVVAGWANKALTPFVKRILLTHPSSVTNFPTSKAIVVGLPIEEELQDVKCIKKFTPPLLFITCGKQGSHVINKIIFPLVPELIKHFTVVHQTGSNSIYKDIDKARRLKESLGDLKNRYFPASYYFGKEFATLLTSAKIVISRSGAHTCYKLALLKKSSILVPIPWVSHNEQMANALLTQKYAPTIIIEEKNLTPTVLLDAISKVRQIKLTTGTASVTPDASNKIIQVIHEYL